MRVDVNGNARDLFRSYSSNTQNCTCVNMARLWEVLYYVNCFFTYIFRIKTVMCVDDTTTTTSTFIK